jgi:hypothetical protein
MDQNDLFTFFMTLKKQHAEEDIPRILEMYEITKLDINRIYRYLDKYMEKDVDACVDDELYGSGGDIDHNDSAILC